MLNNILLIVSGLLFILLQKSNWHKKYIITHNFSELDEFLCVIRNIIGGILVFLGILFMFI